MASGANWPDPDPVAGAPPTVDDVTRMNATAVERIFCVRDESDILAVLELAREHGKKVSMRGTRHSMGGHTVTEGGFVIDCMKLNKHSFDPDTRLVTTEPGAMWADLIKHLNQYGYSPRTMQSYSTFSVGGSLAVNAHGITTDFCGAESVEEFDLIKWNGEKVKCSRGADGEAGELFSLALGGYGMFGIMTQIVMKVNLNCHLSMDMIQTDATSFSRLYSHALDDPAKDIEIKLARMDVTNLDHIDLFIFRRDNPSGMRTISRLEAEPREMGTQQQMLYKWIMPSFKEARYAMERASGAAIDWGDENERNQLMFESAVPLAKLYSPAFVVDDTFVLQEYFVPKAGYRQWIADAKPIYKQAEKLDQVDLLNTTIRYVHQDTDTALAYSRAEGGSFAFVLYYRIRRSAEADAQLATLHTAFVEITLRSSGTFYLPYRHHYSEAEMDAAYPNVQHFFERKQHYDPTCMFSSSWFERYGRRFWLPTEESIVCAPLEMHHDQPDGPFEVYIPEVSTRRSDSFTKLMNDRKMRTDFRDQFLIRIFNIENNRALFGMISKAVYDTANSDDQSVFEHLQSMLAENSSAIHTAATMWKQVKQIRHQKRELVRETAGILSHLGRLGTLVGYVSIGDNGKMVLPFRHELGLQGLCYVVHDKDPDAVGDSNLAVNVERGCTSAVGEFVPIDYLNIDSLRIPSACADLVTMNQGLHHLPPAQLPRFLAEVRRILRPSGIFIVREHDASDHLIPMLDLAHSVFNAVTGVCGREERNEIRAFRPVLQWRKIIESAGFIDSMLYEMEQGDPTLDEMMCFVKPPFKLDSSDAVAEASRKQSQTAAGVIPSSAIPVPVPLKLAMQQAPAALIDTVKGLLNSLQQGIRGLESFVNRQSSRLSTGQAYAVQSLTKSFFETSNLYLSRFRPVFENVQLQDTVGFNFPLEELGIIVQSLLKKGENGRASANELALIAIIKDVKSVLYPSEAASHTTATTDDDDEDAGEENFEDALDADTEPLEVTLHSQGRHDPTPSEVEALLRQVLEVHPYIAEPDFLTNAGVPSRAQVAILGQFAGSSSNIRGISAGLCNKLDAYAFDSFVRAIGGVVRAGESERLSWEAVQNPNSVWWSAAMSVLGSSHVNFTSRGVMMASVVGLDPIVRMWEAARSVRQEELRQERLKRHQQERQGGKLPRHKNAAIDAHSRQGLVTALEWISNSVHTTSILVKWSDGNEWKWMESSQDLVDVSEILEATIVVEHQQTDGRQIKESHDCSLFVQKIFEESCGVGQQQAARDVCAAQTRIFRLGAEEMNRVLGWIGLDSTEASPQPQPYRFGDITRGVIKAIVGTDQIQPPTRITCTVRYTVGSSEDRDPEALLPHVKVLLERCQRAGQLRDLHTSHGEFTWLKLSEWMQVEILEIYAASLSHTPWYRFPYVDMLSLYWRVLSNEVTLRGHPYYMPLFIIYFSRSRSSLTVLLLVCQVGIVAEKHGLKKALLSSAVATDVVPGIFMAILFGQLQLFALPLRALLGEAYSDPMHMVEQMVVLTGDREPDWLALDDRITEPIQLVPKLYTIEVPTFKAMTEILMKLSTDATLQVLQISNQNQVQVRVEIHPDQVEHGIRLLQEKRGCDVMFDYAFPTDGTQNAVWTTVSLCVEIPYLLGLLRFCTSNGIAVKQIYDWWC